MALHDAEPFVLAGYSVVRALCALRGRWLDFGVQLLIGRCQPILDFRVCFGFVVAILLLQHAGQFFRLAAQPLDVVVGEFGKRLSHLAFEFMPLAVQNVLGRIHVNFSLRVVQFESNPPCVSDKAMPGCQMHRAA
jgi:hypothetical protein